MSSRYLVALLAIAVFASLGAADAKSPTAPKSLKAREAKAKLDRDAESAERAYVQQLIAAKEKYVESMREAKRVAVNAKDIDEAVAADAEIEATTAAIAELKARPKGKKSDGIAIVEASGDDFVLTELVNDVKAYKNRAYVFSEIPQKLTGWRFTRVAGGKPTTITVKVKKAGLVFAASQKPTDILEKQGWKRVPDATFRSSDDKKNEVFVFAKPAVDGDEFALPQTASFSGSMLLLPPEEKPAE